MAQVLVKLSDRTYQLECDSADELRLQELSQYVARKVEALKRDVGSPGHERLLLMAALSIADDLWDARETAGTSLTQTNSSASGRVPSQDLTEKLQLAAKKLKILAARMEEPKPVKISLQPNAK